MEFINEILAMVQQILEYVKEADAAAIVAIVKDYIEPIISAIPMPF